MDDSVTWELNTRRNPWKCLSSPKEASVAMYSLVTNYSKAIHILAISLYKVALLQTVILILADDIQEYTEIMESSLEVYSKG